MFSSYNLQCKIPDYTVTSYTRQEIGSIAFKLKYLKKLSNYLQGNLYN